MVAVRIKRAYEAAAAGDGTRVLVDRLWPRGLSREAAHVDIWLKDVAPSEALRRFFGHDPAKWLEFRERYLAELADNPAVAQLRSLLRRGGTLTLLFAAKDIEHNNAIVLRELLTRPDGS
jgi:uncharacterized protein YeaO (DUF488 family)